MASSEVKTSLSGLNWVAIIPLDVIQGSNMIQIVNETLKAHFQAKVVCSDMNGAPCTVGWSNFG